MKKFIKNCLTSFLVLTGVIVFSGFSAYADAASSALTPSAAAGDVSVAAAVASSNPTAIYFYPDTPTLEQNQLLYQYFKNSVIVGDSIGCGWGLQCLKNSSDPVMGNFQSLAYPGFCIHSAFDASIEEAGTPMYKGARRPVWESLQLMAAEHPGETTHVYLHFGYKDQKWTDTPEMYVQLIQTLKQYVPDSDYTIIGASYMYPGKNGAPYTSANIKALNLKMQNYAKANGWGYLNVGDLLANENGDLEPSYCSDKFMHITPEAYEIWRKALIGYAFTRMTAAGIS